MRCHAGVCSDKGRNAQRYISVTSPLFWPEWETNVGALRFFFFIAAINKSIEMACKLKNEESFSEK